MKAICILLVLSGSLVAAPRVRQLPWAEACDGAEIEVVEDNGATISVRASARGTSEISEWTILHANGNPVAAECRLSRRERVLKGENAGEYSGVISLVRVVTGTVSEGLVKMPDESLQKQLADILGRVNRRAE